MAAVAIDPTAKGKYPIILGDGLLGKTPNDIFTGVRYNHKPSPAAADGPAHARIKPSLPGKTSSYDLSFSDSTGSYAYAGTRTVDGNQYVLHFDPERKAFILDKIDSVFNMNLTRTPATSDPDRLARQFPPIGPIDSASRKPDDGRKAGPDGGSKQPKTKPRSRPAAASASNSKATARIPGKLSMPPPPPRRKPDKKESSKPAQLLLPKPEPPRPEPLKDKKSTRRKDDEDEDEEEDDGDGDLLIEYPGREDAGAAAKRTDFSPAFPAYRAFDDFMDKRDSEGDADSPGELDADFKLPPLPATADGDDDDDAAAAASVNMEDDLEKEMEIAFEDLANSHNGSPQGGGGGDESEISEED